MKNIILARPNISIGNFFSKKNSKNDNFNNKLYFKDGRSALLWGLIKSGIKPGDTIIFPAYICKSTLEPLIDFGINISFIDIEMDLSLSIQKLDIAIKESDAKAVIAVHYFGIINNLEKIKNLCKKYKVLLVEDCCHCFPNFFYENSKTNWGDFSYFSVRKFLPIIDGGILINHNKNIVLLNQKTENLKIKILLNSFKYVFVRLIEYFCSQILQVNIYSEKITKIKLRIRSLILKKNKKEKSSCLPNMQAPSFFLKNYYKRPNLLEKIAKIRRRNYFILTYKLEKIGYKSFKSLKKDKLSVPQWWIYYDSTKNLNKYLRTQGIGSCCWPGEEMPETINSRLEDFPNTKKLSNSLCLIPIHQSINNVDIKNIYLSLKEFTEMESMA